MCAAPGDAGPRCPPLAGRLRGRRACGNSSFQGCDNRGRLEDPLFFPYGKSCQSEAWSADRHPLYLRVASHDLQPREDRKALFGATLQAFLQLVWWLLPVRRWSGDGKAAGRKSVSRPLAPERRFECCEWNLLPDQKSYRECQCVSPQEPATRPWPVVLQLVYAG